MGPYGFSHDTYNMLKAITDLGDSAVLTAIVAGACLYLLFAGCRREAAAFGAVYLLTVIISTIFKLTLLDCYSRAELPQLRSPSGHAALSIVTFGMLAFLTSRCLSGPVRWIPLLLAAILTGLIALTRVLLGFHTPYEVITGLLVGTGCFVAVWWAILRGHRARHFDWRIPLLWLLIAGVTLCGIRSPGETLLIRFAAATRAYDPCGR